jgi:hypothetical protein
MSKKDDKKTENKEFRNTIGSNLDGGKFKEFQSPDKEEPDEKEGSISPLVDPEIKDPEVPLVNGDPEKPLSPLTEPNAKDRSGDNHKND